MGESGKHSHSLLRRINAFAAAALIVFLTAHAAMGIIGIGLRWRGGLEGLIWLCLVVIALHVILSACTTYAMFTDKTRPPGRNKKRHQILKWVSGCVVLVAALSHMEIIPLDVRLPTTQGALMAVALMAALAWHGFVGVKSLTRDMGLPSEIRTPIRVSLIVVAAVLSLGVVIAIGHAGF